MLLDCLLCKECRRKKCKCRIEILKVHTAQEAKDILLYKWFCKLHTLIAFDGTKLIWLWKSARQIIPILTRVWS